MKRVIGACLLWLVAAAVLPPNAQAFFHEYKVREIYSNADGSVQFVELFTTDIGQFFLNGHTLTALQCGSMNTFTFVGLGPFPTENRPLLLATSSFETQCGVVPDYVLEDGFLFQADGSVDFGPGADVVSYSSLPVDGVMSLHFPAAVIGMNSPENFAGDTCQLGPPSVPGVGFLLLFILPVIAGFAGARINRRVGLGQSGGAMEAPRLWGRPSTDRPTKSNRATSTNSH